jgi:thiamine biosynthesis lipoprotein
MIRRRFRAMGTDMKLVLDARPGGRAIHALAAAERELRLLESLLSRFDPASQLSQLNRQGAMRAGPDLLAVVELALAAREQTGGRFDPTVHNALVAAGYDRSFEQLPAERPDRAPETAVCGGAVRVDRNASTIELGPDVHLDLGGIAKGYAADRAAAILADIDHCLVDAGGDIAVRGGPWSIGVETGEGTLTLELAGGAVATSGRDRRRWKRGREEQHHIVDPAHGRPAEGDLLRVSVVAASAAEAEVLAKALFLAGADGAAREADEGGIPAVLVTRDGRTLLAGGLA